MIIIKFANLRDIHDLFLGDLREDRWNVWHIHFQILLKEYKKKITNRKKWYIYKEAGWSPMSHRLLNGIQIAPLQL